MAFAPILIFLSKYRVIFSWIFIFIIFLIICFNKQNNDFEGYQDIFQDPASYAEPGYIFLVDLLKLLGANGHESVLLSFAVLVSYSFRKIFHLTKYFYLWAYIYFLFLLPLDITQVRFGIASFLILNSTLLFYKKNNIYGLLLLISSVLFHYVAIIFFIIIIFSMIKYDYRKLIYISVFLFLSSFLFFKYIFDILPELGLPVRNLYSYTLDGIKYISWATWVTPIVITLIISETFEKKSSIKNYEIFYLYSLIKRITIISLGFSAGLLYLYEFNRVYRLIFMFQSLSVIFLLSYLGCRLRLYLYLYLVILIGFFGIYYSYNLKYDYIYWGIE